MKPSPVTRIHTGQSNAVAACAGCGARIVAPMPADVMQAAGKRGWRDDLCRGCQERPR